MEKLREICSKTFTPEEMQTLDRAIEFTKGVHAHQTRHSGEPYYTHPESVAIMLANMGMDSHTILAGLMHDVIEDGKDITYEKLASMFGQDIAGMVDGVTKLTKTGKNEMISREDIQAESFRKMFLAIANDIRVVIIKLNDRLHNMRTLQYCSEEKQIRKARETLDIYAPLAHRFGMGAMKCELEDLCMKYLWPEEYKKLEQAMIPYQEERMRTLNKAMEEIERALKEAGIEATLSGRPKHFYSIYKKTVRQQKTIDEIYDLIAIRVIVNTVNDCYATLGIIHSLWKPMPGRFKDYIAMPKANMYQSLHTTLIGSSGQPFEIQIRTYEMHKTAEYGIAAHWKYKEASDGKKINTGAEEEKLSWLRQILEWQRDMSDNREFMNLLKSDLDLFSDSVYCFTPTGDVKNLPAGSTPIDFAYSIHSAVGNKMIGARVNGKLVTIDYVINNGDRVEILTSQNSKGPSRDWLNVVKSTQARNKINQWFKNELKDDNIIKGRELLLSYCKAKAINQVDIMRPEYMESIMKKFGFRDWESVLAALGHGGLKEGQIINKMKEMYDRDHPKELSDEEVIKAVEESAAAKQMLPRSKTENGIVVKGIHDVAVRFSKCCSPVPGDEIIGFVTRGRGISIHRTDCVNIINLPEIERSRLIDAEWQDESIDGKGRYFAEITIYANNRNGLLADVSRALTEKNIDIQSMNTRTSKQGVATMNVAFEISSKEELNRVIDKLHNIESVLSIERTTG